jgi:transcription initiation factor TFIIIB Brf1 subunit/transcription initiation factor TFIIB
MVRGRTISAAVAASIYIASMEAGVPRNISRGSVSAMYHTKRSQKHIDK